MWGRNRPIEHYEYLGSSFDVVNAPRIFHKADRKKGVLILDRSAGLPPPVEQVQMAGWRVQTAAGYSGYALLSTIKLDKERLSSINKMLSFLQKIVVATHLSDSSHPSPEKNIFIYEWWREPPKVRAAVRFTENEIVVANNYVFNNRNAAGLVSVLDPPTTFGLYTTKNVLSSDEEWGGVGPWDRRADYLAGFMRLTIRAIRDAENMGRLFDVPDESVDRTYRLEALSAAPQ